MTTERRIIPLLLSGGAGSRLWPLSRDHYPKQLLNLCSARSLLQDTAGRVADPACYAPPLVICNHEHRFIIAEQLRQINQPAAAIVLEPVGRNTAPAVAVAALMARNIAPDALLLVLPADHRVGDPSAFQAAVRVAKAAAAAGNLTTFGIIPTAPETGYGYIRRGSALAGANGAFQVAGFVEKPSRSVAESYLADGNYVWNSGMFLLPVQACLDELADLAPTVLAQAQAALTAARQDLDFVRLDEAAFAAAPSISIDYAIMEKTRRAAVVPVEMGWTDVGAWSALWEVGEKDPTGNVCIGDVIAEGASGCYVRSEGPLTAVVGLADAIVVVTDDAVLVTDRAHAQEVKAVVERLKQSGRSEPFQHRRVHRPWGFYQSLHTGERFQVKRLTLRPGARLSLQKHYHRSEHWVVVNGTALVTRGDEQILLRENESVHIPLGTVHRLENPGKLDLNLIEVQSGAYFGEDDIIRLDDVYGRG